MAIHKTSLIIHYTSYIKTQLQSYFVSSICLTCKFFGVWEETEVPGVNPRRHGENILECVASMKCSKGGAFPNEGKIRQEKIKYRLSLCPGTDWQPVPVFGVFAQCVTMKGISGGKTR